MIFGEKRLEPRKAYVWLPKPPHDWVPLQPKDVRSQTPDGQVVVDYGDDIRQCECLQRRV